MARFKIQMIELRERLLPAVCMLCGAATGDRVVRSYRWIRALSTGAVTTELPVCKYCESACGRKYRKWLTVSGICLVSSPISWWLSTELTEMFATVFAFMSIGTIALGTILLPVVFVVHERMVNSALRINERWVEFLGLHPEFVRAVQERRKSYAPEHRRSLFGDVRDDYED